MGKLLTGQQLRKIFDHYCPFDEEGNLRPNDERVTLCANNSNTWWQTRAFVQAAAQGDQSPMVIQFSYNANRKIGGDPTAIFIPEGVTYHANPVTNSARIMSDWLAMEVDCEHEKESSRRRPHTGYRFLCQLSQDRVDFGRRFAASSRSPRSPLLESPSPP